MTDTTTPTALAVNTVLGPVPAQELGVVAIHEALLSVVPGAQFAPDISLDRAEIFETLAGKLHAFREAGGGTIVDSTGMFHGRDLALYEALSRSTGVHIVASTGMGPEENLGGYFLTPQTNPPTPWPAGKFADLFSKEATAGMVVPRLERRATAGLVTTTAAGTGMTPTDESLFRGAARTARETGIPVSIRFGADPLAELDIVLAENLPAERVLVASLDRRDAKGAALEVALRGAYVGLDHAGTDDAAFLDDTERAALVMELVAAGFAGRIILSSNAVGVAKGHPGTTVSFGHVLTEFVPRLRSMGLTDADAAALLIENPRELLTVRRAQQPQEPKTL
ncbi:MAG: phosphotriesterase [Paeniglutamicibacter sp.]